MGNVTNGALRELYVGDTVRCVVRFNWRARVRFIFSGLLAISVERPEINTYNVKIEPAERTCQHS